MNIRWTEEATVNLEHISLHIADENPGSSFQNRHYGLGAHRGACWFPNRGRKGREEGTRELVLVPLPHIVTYRVKDSTIEILHIWHGAQKRHE